MAFGTSALKAKIAAVEAQAKKDVQTLKDRLANAETNIKAIVEADAPIAVADITKFGEDLAALVTRVEALEESAKASALKDAAAAASAVSKAASKVKAAKTEVVAEPAAPAEPVETPEAAPQA